MLGPIGGRTPIQRWPQDANEHFSLPHDQLIFPYPLPTPYLGIVYIALLLYPVRYEEKRQLFNVSRGEQLGFVALGSFML